MEIKPSDTETTVTLTKAQVSDFGTSNIVKLAIVMSIVGVIGMISIVYLLTRKDDKV
jgi:hypothetical protein